MSTFSAAYSGTCASCESRIYVGDEIMYAGTSVVHAECPETDKAPEYGYCPSCFLNLPASRVCHSCDD